MIPEMNICFIVEDSEDDQDDLIVNGLSKLPEKNEDILKTREVLISDSKPIMVCNNTMNKNHKCVFCKCFDCHMKEVLQKENDDRKKGKRSSGDDHQVITPRHCSKRVNRAKNVAQGQLKSTKKGKGGSNANHVQCNHVDDLSLFTDATFFTRSYKLKNQKINDSKKSKIYLPTKCSVCDCEIVTKIGKKS